MVNIPPIKKSDKKHLLNYRSVSLTSVPSKIFEKLIRRSIETYLKANNLLSRHQFYFRSMISCLTMLPAYFQELEDVMKEGFNIM